MLVSDRTKRRKHNFGFELSFETHSPSEVRKADELGTEPASLALFHGNRVMYALCVWKSLNWPAMAVCQMLRARMELEVKCLSV